MKMASCSNLGMNQPDDLKPGTLSEAVKENRKEDVVNYQASADRNTIEWDRELATSAMIAIIKKKPDILLCLVEAGEDFNNPFAFNKSTGQREPLLYTAFRSGDPTIVDIVIETLKEKGALTDNILGIGLLTATFESRNPDMVTRAWAMLEEKYLSDSNAWYPVHDLVASEFSPTYANDILTYLMEEIFEFLIGKGYSIDECDEFSNTPLALAVHQDDMAEVRALISHGANVFLSDQFNTRTWVVACENRNYDIMRELLASVCLSPHQELFESFLHQACEHGWQPADSYLLNRGVNVNSPDNENRTPLMLAVERCSGKVVECLVQHMLHHNKCDSDSAMIKAFQLLFAGCHDESDCSKMEKFVKSWIKGGVNLNCPGPGGHTILMGLDIGETNFLHDLLVTYGADVYAVAGDGYSVLWKAASFDTFEILDYYDWDQTADVLTELKSNKVNFLKRILSQNIDIGISKYQHEGMTPLQVAFHLGDLQICNLLLDADCSLYNIVEFLSEIPQSERPHLPMESRTRVVEVSDGPYYLERLQWMELRTRILEMCDKPYSLKAQARLAVLRAIGQCDFRKTLDRIHRSGLLPKALVNFLGKAIAFNVDK